MRRRGIGLVTLCAAALVLAGPPRTVAAQETVAPAGSALRAPFLTINIDRLYAKTLYGKGVEARFKADSDALIAENLRLEKALEAEERDLTDRRATLAPADFKPLAAAFDAKAEQIRAAQLAKSRSIAAKREAEQQRFLEVARPILVQLMQEAGAVALVNENMVIAKVSGIDITDAAIARIDAVLGDGRTAPSGAAPADEQTQPQPPVDPAPTPQPAP